MWASLRKPLALSRFCECRDGTAVRPGSVVLHHRLSGSEVLVGARIADMFRPGGPGVCAQLPGEIDSPQIRDALERHLGTLCDAGFIVECDTPSPLQTVSSPPWSTEFVSAPIRTQMLENGSVVVHPLVGGTSLALTASAVEFVHRIRAAAILGDVSSDLYGPLRSREREELLDLVRRLIQKQVIGHAGSAAALAPEDVAFLDAYASTRQPLGSPTYLHSSPPPIFKHYEGPSIALPRATGESEAPLERTILNRRSQRTFGPEPVTLNQLGRLLSLANGFKGIVDAGTFGPCAVTTSPSAGSRHPLEIYVAARRVQDLEPGIHHYDLERHRLVPIRTGEHPSREALQSLVGLEAPDAVAAVLLITAVFRRSTWKYGPRAFRFVHIDAGHLGQNVYLAAEALGLGVCGIGGWREEELDRLLGLDPRSERLVYTLILGNRAGAATPHGVSGALAREDVREH